MNMPSPPDHLPETLPQWLNWVEKLHPAEVELGLGRVRAVAQKLGLVDCFKTNGVNVITIAGTNGKGSTAATLERLACSSGLSVGCFTSPHFLRYNERIRINGIEADDSIICAAFSAIEPHTHVDPLTYFEYGTLAALQVFQQIGVELVILEVGLGGRLDAVNIIDADLAIITSIGIDHEDWLGDSRELIGREKAGILRTKQRLVCSEPNLPNTVIELIDQLQVRSFIKDSAFSLRQPPSARSTDAYEWHGVSADDGSLVIPDLAKPSIPLESVAAAIQAFALLYPVKLTDEVVKSTLAGLTLPGRFFQVPNKPVILDVAHNPDAAAYLASQLQQYLAPVPSKAADTTKTDESNNTRKPRVIAVFAGMADKDIDGIVQALAASIDFWFLAELDLPRAATKKQLVKLFERQGINDYRTMRSVEFALIEAEAMLNDDDIILVFGSFFTAAAAIDAWGIGSLAELTCTVGQHSLPKGR
ncbi:MAG: bifunctional tetrahydrofolate synthase/dihydrofolate synthase [Pseudomonadales bacterium]|nr:bifunctional tetrahydrofolate synthase/dihydrofolate synthase [Pseudomonadales bacterium]